MEQEKKKWVPPTVAQWLQWRLDFAKHLEGVTLRYQKYKRWSASWDHDHCAACWATFAEFDGDNENDSYPERDGEPLEDKLEYMRRRQNKRVGYLAVLIGADHKELNGQANKHVGCASVDVATEEQLRRRAIYIEQRIRECGFN